MPYHTTKVDVCLRMLEDYVGEPNFQKGPNGVSKGLQISKMRKGQDLWDAIGKASKMPVIFHG